MRLRGKIRRFSTVGERRSKFNEGRLIVTLVVFCLAVVEASVVSHLARSAIVSSSRGALSYGPFVLSANAGARHALSSGAIYAEFAREMSVLLILVGLGLLAGRDRVERFATFLWVVGIYVIAGYAARLVLLGAPKSLLAKDAFVMLSRSLVLPVYIPVALAVLSIAIASVIFMLHRARRIGRLTL